LRLATYVGREGGGSGEPVGSFFGPSNNQDNATRDYGAELITKGLATTGIWFVAQR